MMLLTATGLGCVFAVLAWYAVRASRAQKQLLRLLADARDGLVTFRADGAIKVYNAGLQEMFGYAETEIAGTNIAELLPDVWSYAGVKTGSVASRGWPS